jgi:diaminohydroxyphosphoribosylaminopyrimidine deaminase/5-amino-6-(5-phosphoribosylamino)uracil reductase
MSADEIYMHRCIELAANGRGFVAPNPLVGAVLVYNNSIIGEGYHQGYGQPHAEVNCINSVEEQDCRFIKDSVLYVSLEPCTHFGKTPPCADLIVNNKIHKVVIGSLDPFDAVNGKGIDKLNKAGIEVVNGVLKKLCYELNKHFFTFHTKKRPYILLKWAETADCKIAITNGMRLLISNDYSNRVVHQLRSQYQAILVGTNTAKIDNPSLTNRYWNGKNPIRLVVDLELKLPGNLHVFDQQQLTIVFNTLKQEEKQNILFYKIEITKNLVQQILDACFKLNIQSIMVEGGAKLLQSFIDSENWDETMIITNNQMFAGDGIMAPNLENASLKSKQILLNDTIQYFVHE